MDELITTLKNKGWTVVPHRPEVLDSSGAPVVQGLVMSWTRRCPALTAILGPSW